MSEQHENVGTDTTRAIRVLSPGTTVSHYRILEKLGEGGMGVVYRTEDTRLGRHVALKFLSSHLTEDTEARERFVQEAQAASALDHPSICTIYEIDELDDGRVFIAMACYEGETLKDRIARGPVEEPDAIDVASHIASGLNDAHDAGIVHRDVKPANVMITARDRIKIMDFGLAKLAGQTGLTMAGTTVGTVAYMSPEQARGEEVDGRTDLWSLGVVLYEMLTGRQPFKGDHPQAVIRSILNDEPEPLRRARPVVSEESGTIVARALAKDPAARYQSAQEMLSDLSKAGAALSRKAGEGGSLDLAERPSIAVLPFANLSGDPEQEYFCDGITEELINALAQIEDLRVAARTSSFAFKGKLEDIREIGRRLGVDTVVEGSVRKAGDRVRITAQVIKVADGYHVWSDRYDRDLEDIFAIQDEISEKVAEKLRGELLEEEKPRVAERHGDDVEAYSLYMKGRYFWNKRTKDGIERGIECFEQAIERSPDYALAYSGLADCYLVLAGNGLAPAAECVPEALAAVERALELDDSLAEAHATLGWIKGNFKLDWEGAKEEFRRAIELKPDYATVHQWYAVFLAFLGTSEEAIAEAEHAASLDPLSLSVGLALAYVLYIARRYDRVIEQCEKVLDMDPSFAPARHYLAVSYLEEGMHERAIAMIKDLVAALPGAAMYKTEMVCIYARAGKRGESEKLLEELKAMSERIFVPSYGMARACACMGRNDEAFEYLEKVLEEKYGLVYLKRDPMLDGLRADPRFEELLERTGID